MWPGVGERLDREAAGLERRPSRPAVVAPSIAPSCGDVVGVRVRRQHVPRRSTRQRSSRRRAAARAARRSRRRPPSRPPRPPTRYAFESQLGIHAPLDEHRRARLHGSAPTRRTNGRSDVTRVDGRQGEVLEAARPRRGSRRRRSTTRTRSSSSCSRTSSAASPTSSPRRSGSSSRQTQLEQSVVKLDDAGAPGARPPAARTSRGRRSSGSPALQQQLQGLDEQVEAARGSSRRSSIASEKQLSAKVEAFRSQKEVDQGAVLGRRGAGADRRGGDRDRRADGRHRARDPAREGQDRADAGARVGDRRADRRRATLEDFTSDQTQLDRELAQIASQSQVDDELAQLKAELGSGEEQEGARAE